jgi:glucokinase
MTFALAVTSQPGVVAVADRACLAIDFGGSKVAVAVFEQSGAISAQERIDIEPGMNAVAVLRQVAELGKKLIGTRNDLVIGAVSPGVILHDRILLAPNVDGWSDVALASQLKDLFGIREVRVANDVKAAAAAEYRWGNLRGCDPGVYLNLGTGIAAALVIGGVVVSGANGAAGEIGYNPTGDRTQLLEHIIGAHAIVRRGLLLSKPLSTTQIFLEAGRVSEAGRLVETFVAELSTQLLHLVHLVDPRRIVLGGGLSAATPLLIPLLCDTLSSQAGIIPELSIAAFGTQSSLHGARLVGVSS